MEKIYKVGTVYKITSPHTENTYIGSTTKTIERRLNYHLKTYKRYIEGTYKKFYTAFDIIKLGDAKIECIEEFRNVSRSELEKNEGKYIKNFDNTVNKNIPGRTIEEWRQENMEKIKIQRAGHYIKNKDEIIEKVHKYSIENKEQIKIRDAQKFQKNKHLRFECECGQTHGYGHKARHLKSKRHIDIVSKNIS